MKIIEFNPHRGSYQFELNRIDSLSHAHPAAEFVLAKEGYFCLETAAGRLEHLKSAIISANVKHQVYADDCSIYLVLMEWEPHLLMDFLDKHNVILKQGVFTSKEQKPLIKTIFETLDDAFVRSSLKTVMDSRVQICLDYFKEEITDYTEMLPTLMSRAHLSESRLSHLFKGEMGISLKKYAVWNRLKNTISLMLQEQINLYEASLRCGFYDQAHMSRAFKQMLGMRPSDVYNSRILQD